eukprot:gene21807-28828_t
MVSVVAWSAWQRPQVSNSACSTGSTVVNFSSLWSPGLLGSSYKDPSKREAWLSEKEAGYVCRFNPHCEQDTIGFSES